MVVEVVDVGSFQDVLADEFTNEVINVVDMSGSFGDVWTLS
jgi:hypothetical protein